MSKNGTEKTGKDSCEKSSATTQVFDWCRGVGSIVKSDNAIRDYHVLQLDLDEVTNGREAVRNLIREFCPLGTYLIFQNGGKSGSYHVASVTYYDKETVVDTKAKITRDDAKHLKMGLKRDYWILRCSAKSDRPKPELVEVFTKQEVKGKPQSMCLSESHLEIYEELYPDFDLRSLMPAFDNTLNASTVLETYPTRLV